MLSAAGLASAGLATAKTSEPKPVTDSQPQLGDWGINHAGCCGCAVSVDAGNDEFTAICNECGDELNVMVNELAFRKLTEALQRAQHALNFASGSIAHDGKPEHSYTLDFRKELKFIDEALQAARVDPMVLKTSGIADVTRRVTGYRH